MRWLLGLMLFVGLNSAWAGEWLPEQPDKKLSPPLVCSDFLKALGVQRNDMEFVACEPIEFGGVNSLEAKYRVEGKDVLKVENWLIHFAKVRRLRRACCIWETSTEGFRGKDGALYEIRMYGESNSTSVNRDGLKTIPFFYVFVTHGLYLP